MQADSRKLVWDALQAIELGTRFTRQVSFDSFRGDPLLRSAVERQFEILGHAFDRVRAADPELAATIPELDRIVALRNILVHGYSTADERLMWGMVDSVLPRLRSMLRELLEED